MRKFHFENIETYKIQHLYCTISMMLVVNYVGVESLSTPIFKTKLNVPIFNNIRIGLTAYGL